MHHQWVGVQEELFKKYQNWVNREGTLCGTYAAAVLIAYYQDYREEITLPDFIRIPHSMQGENLTHYLRLFIQPLGFSTITLQVTHGMSRFLRYFGMKKWARSTPIGGWDRCVKRMNQQKPVIVGLNKYLGSTYGNHWVVAYAYKVDEEGKRWLKIHDNWGRYNAVIPASWVLGTVSFE